MFRATNPGCLKKRQSLAPTNGFIEIPKGPSLGIELDEDALADKITVDDWKNPQKYDPDDDSVTDW